MADPILTIKLEGDGSGGGSGGGTGRSSGGGSGSGGGSSGSGSGGGSGGGSTGGGPTRPPVDPESQTLQHIAQITQQAGSMVGGAMGRVLNQTAGNLFSAVGRGQQLAKLYDTYFGNAGPAASSGGGTVSGGGPGGGLPSANNPAARANATNIGPQDDTPVLDEAAFGDVMALPRGVAQRVGEDGIPILDEASMTDVMGQFAKTGNIPMGIADVGGDAAEAAAAAGGMSGGMAGLVLASAQNQVDGAKKAVGSYNDLAGIISGGAQMALGPILGPIAGSVIDGVSEAFGSLMRSPALLAEAIGAPMAALAGGENANAVKMVADGMVGLASYIPLAGKSFEIMGETAQRVTAAFTGVVNAFVDRGRVLSGYSGGMAASYAVGDVAQMMADIKEAQTLDPSLSRMNDAQNELSLMLRDLLLPIKKFVAEKLANIMDGIVIWLKNFLDWADAFKDGVVAFINEVGPYIVAIYNAVELISSAGSALFWTPKKWEDIIVGSIKAADKEELFTIDDGWDNLPRDFPAGPWAMPDLNRGVDQGPPIVNNIQPPGAP